MEQLKKILIEKIIELINKNSLWDTAIYLALFVCFCMASGALIFWLWKRHKIKAETNKILKETEKLSLELIEKKLSFIKEIKPYKVIYRKFFELLNLSLRSTVESATSHNIQELDSNREEAIRIFCSDLLPSFVDYSEVAMSINDKAENKFFLVNEVFPFLQHATNFINTVNMLPILNLVQKSSIHISEETLTSLYHIVEPNLSVFWITHNYKYRGIKKGLQTAQQ